MIVVRGAGPAAREHKLALSRVGGGNAVSQKLWKGGVLLSDVMASVPAELLRGLDCVEVGSGVNAFPSQALAASGARSVVATDSSPEAAACVDDCAERAGLPALRGSVLDWEKLPERPDKPFSLVVGSEITYLSSLLPMLLRTIAWLWSGGGAVPQLAVIQDPGRDYVVDDMEARAADAGLRVVGRLRAPRVSCSVGFQVRFAQLLLLAPARDPTADGPEPSLAHERSLQVADRVCDDGSFYLRSSLPAGTRPLADAFVDAFFHCCTRPAESLLRPAPPAEDQPAYTWTPVAAE